MTDAYGAPTEAFELSSKRFWLPNDGLTNGGNGLMARSNSGMGLNHGPNMILG